MSFTHPCYVTESQNCFLFATVTRSLCDVGQLLSRFEHLSFQRRCQYNQLVNPRPTTHHHGTTLVFCSDIRVKSELNIVCLSKNMNWKAIFIIGDLCSTKSYSNGHFRKWKKTPSQSGPLQLGKPSSTNSAVFFNIVQRGGGGIKPIFKNVVANILSY